MGNTEERYQNLSVCLVLPPDDDSVFMCEITRFVDVLPMSSESSVTKFLSDTKFLRENLEQKYRIKLDTTLDSDGSVELTIFNLDTTMFDYEAVLDEICDTFFEKIESHGLEIMTHGILSQEIKVQHIESSNTVLN